MIRYASLFLLIIAVSGVIAFIAWKDFDTSSSSNSALTARRSYTTVERTQSRSEVTTSTVSSVSQSLVPTLNQRFREAKDYAHFVAEIRPMATAGNTEAQYLTAKALKWCAQTMHLYFIRPNGEVHTLEEVQARFAARPVGISQQDLAMIYSRCQGFLESPELRKSTESWNEWLDKSADGAYPAAIAQRAANLELLILESGSSLPHEDRGIGAEAQAKELALSAAESGDPDAIFLMSDWVRTGNRTDDETATLINAWRILACQKGYDCGPHSDWMISVCSWNPQCADGGTYVDYFQRQLGNQYYDALRLAKSIDEAITANDVRTLRSYL
jgi:hypothetical protein